VQNPKIMVRTRLVINHYFGSSAYLIPIKE
jgi:hypothetical protein